MVNTETGELVALEPEANASLPVISCMVGWSAVDMLMKEIAALGGRSSCCRRVSIWEGSCGQVLAPEFRRELIDGNMLGDMMKAVCQYWKND